MESKREEIAKKLDKFAFNIKNIDRIIAFMVALFIIFAVVVYSKKNAEVMQQEAAYNRMLAELQAHQLNVIYANVTPNNGEIDGTKQKEAPMFTDGVEATAFAFEQLYNSTSYETYGYGNTHAEALGQNVEVIMSFKSVKFEDGSYFDENVRIETQTNFGQTEAIQLFWKDGKKYKRGGSRPRQENGTCVADFNGGFYQVNTSLTSKARIEVRRETIQFCKDFSFARDKSGRITYYKTTVLLDKVKAVETYGKNIQEEGGTTFPIFSQLQVSCIIDRNGNLLSYTTNEIMTVTKKVVIDISPVMNTETTNFIKSINQTPTVPYPTF
ncbi:MAG TPA: hypothetical protein DCO89_02060 [Clostridiales bacterium]|nr:hypothetical protein [Clostridiales bacterium]